jgi:hypothetical protein
VQQPKESLEFNKLIKSFQKVIFLLMGFTKGGILFPMWILLAFSVHNKNKRDNNHKHNGWFMQPGGNWGR